MPKDILFAICLISALTSSQCQLLEGIYCGKSNCYDILGVNRESTKSEIAKNYRKLAKQFHPDVHRDPEDKIAAEEQFKIVANAYEILKDDESRTDYNYMLDNPDQYYAHYYRYYRRRVAPQVDIRLVILVTISIISIIQYYSGWQRYDSAIKYFASVPKYRNRAMDIAKEHNLIHSERRDKRSKTEQKQDAERIILQVIAERMDIKGAYAKPTWRDILFVQIIVFPYTLVMFLCWYTKWIVQHTILNTPFTKEEQLYLIRKRLKMGEHQFSSLEDEQLEEYLERKLYVRENFDRWKAEEEERTKKQLAENTRYKQYRRYMKQHGPSRMTFDDS